MFKLKPLSADGVQAAFEKAERYRLLNEPIEAESICLDILEVDKDNHDARITLILALADQLEHRMNRSISRVGKLIAVLESEYERWYYSGIVSERMGKAALHSGTPGCKYDAYEWLIEAMEQYEKAEALRPPGHDDALLRWNTCARMIRDGKLQQRPNDDFEPYLE